jgi:hypothetical protein
MINFRNNKGTILLLTMLVLVILAAVGLLAVHTVSLEIFRTGNFRIGKEAEQVAKSGLEGSIAYAALDPAGFMDFLKRPAPYTNRVTNKDVSTQFWKTDPLTGKLDVTYDGTFGIDAASISIGSVDNVQFATQVLLLPSVEVPGFSVGEEGFKFNKYSFITSGMYGGAPDQPVQNPEDVIRLGQRKEMAVILIGPVGK